MRQHNLRVTGSLTVNGESVVSASQLSALNSTLTGQYATTGSNSYNGNQTITGSLLVTGVITANEFHTTFVTSSVLYTSGSTKFGDTNDDIMEVTGSLKVDGNITANNLSGIVSGSSQITSLLPTGVISGSSQLTASYDVRYVISGSITQTTWDNIASKPDGIVSSSAQVILQSTTGQLSASRVDGLNLSQIASGSYTASIGQTFNVNTNTIITGSLSVTSLSGSGVNYLAYSGGVVTAISGTAAIKYTQEFSASLGQTTFTPSVGYVSGLIDVYYNGTKLSSQTDYTASNGHDIILTQGADLAGDIVEVDIYNPVNGVSNNVLRQQTTFTASASQTTFTIGYTPGLIDVYFNGSRLSNEEYTANNGTSIILSEATTGGEIVDIFVYSYQVGAFSGVGGSGVTNQLTYWSSQSGITGSTGLTYDGTNLTVVGISGSIASTNGVVSGSSQVVGILTSLNTATASFTPRITNLESKSASVDISITNINSKTGSYATTGSNTFVGTQIISGSTYVQGDLVVYGSSSIQYISASSVSIGTNIVNLNTATPAVRYAGLTVQDSGSAQGVTGSMLWDSCCNRWIYSNPSGVGYSGGVIMSGPRAATFGTETTLTCNYVAKSGGGDHLYDSCIIDDGTTTCIKNNLIGTGTMTLNNASANYATLNLNGAAGYGAELKFGEVTGGYLAAIRHNYNVGTGLEFYTCGLGAGSLRMYIAPTGNVGIGTSNPNAGSSVSGTTVVTISPQSSVSERWGILELAGNRTSGGNQVGEIKFTNINTTNNVIASIGANNSTAVTGGYLSFSTKTDAGSLTERMVISASGSVGIGNVSPTGILQVSSENSGNTQLLLVRNYATSATGNFTGCYTAEIRGTSNGCVRHTMLINNQENDSTRRVLDIGSTFGTIASFVSNGNVGIGTCIPQKALELRTGGTSTTPAQLFFGGISQAIVGGETQIAFSSNISPTLGSPTATELARAGVGFHYLSATQPSEFSIGIQCTNVCNSNFNFWNGEVRMKITSGGDIRMDATSGSKLVTVKGATGNGNYGELRLGNADHSAGVRGCHVSGGNVNLEFWTEYYSSGGYQKRMTIDNAGNIGAPTGTNIFNASDIRLKQNISTITNGLDKILGLNPVMFNWVDNFVESETGKDMLGFIAQEVQNVIPEAVENFGETSIIVGETTIETPLRVNEKFIIPVLTKAIQEQQCIIQSLTNRIEQLENK